MEDMMVKLTRSLLVLLALVIMAGVVPQARTTTSSTAMQQDRTDVFYIVGFVKAPGRYTRKEGTTVADAIETAGGIVGHGFSTRTVLIRMVEGQKIESEAAPTDIVRQADTVYVKRAD
jgi:protein involved in polysaccharide export with SLBB domain